MNILPCYLCKNNPILYCGQLGETCTVGCVDAPLSFLFKNKVRSMEGCYYVWCVSCLRGGSDSKDKEQAIQWWNELQRHLENNDQKKHS